MRLFQFAIAIQLLASCAASDPDGTRFSGRIDEEYYERYTDETLTDDERERCESTSLAKSDVLALIDEYEQTDSWYAYQALTVTPCLFRGEIVYKDRMMHFLWYPSGYLGLYDAVNKSKESEYFICPGHSDQEGEYFCDREHDLGRLR